MKAQINVLVLAALLCTFVGCFEHAVNPQPRPFAAVLYQVPGCGAGLSKATPNDSCFSYQFEKTLCVDFCLTGNCCPDSNRFALAYEIKNDTLAVTVADTAAVLCRCVCTYTIRFELDNLPLDRYVFYCTRNDYDSRLVHYCEVVQRKRGG